MIKTNQPAPERTRNRSVVSWIRDNKILAAVLAGTTLNILLTVSISFSLSYKVDSSILSQTVNIKKSVEENTSENKSLVSSTSQNLVSSTRSTKTEYTISDEDKRQLFKQMMKMMDTWDSSINQYSRLYAQTVEKLLTTKDPTEQVRLEKIREELKWEKGFSEDYYNHTNSILVEIFNVDLGKRQSVGATK